MIPIPKRYIISAMICCGYMLTRMIHHSVKYFHFVHTHTEDYDTDVVLLYLAFCIGNFLSPLTGIAATRYGGVTTLGFAFVLLGSMNLFLPVLHEVHAKWTFIAMFTQGILFSLMSCATTDIWSRWSPIEERFRLSSFIFIGGPIGTLLLFSPMFTILVINWFHHIAGGLTIILAIAWLFIVKNDPDEDKNLTSTEKQILAQRLQFVDTKRTIVATYPWREILKSKPLWTLSLCSFIYTYCDAAIRPRNIGGSSSSVVLVFISTYISQILSPFVAGYIADYLRNHTNLSSTMVHKYFICTAFVVQAFLLVISFSEVPFNETIYISIVTFFDSLSTIALYVNVIDISPNYAGFLNGIKRIFLTLGNIATIMVRSSSWMDDNPELANLYFISSILLFLIGAVVYYFWSSGDLQPWNNSSSDGNELEAYGNSNLLSE